MKDRIQNIQGLRAVAFLAIFICHAFPGPTACLGAWGVSVFLVMSGFLMYRSYAERIDSFREYNALQCVRFSGSKIRKLYPLHIVMLILSIPYAAMNGGSIAKTILPYALLLQTWIPKAAYYETLNAVSWYLSVCAFAYFLFPRIATRIKKQADGREFYGVACLIGLQAAVSGIAFAFGNRDPNGLFPVQWITYYCPIVRVLDFIIGCELGKAHSRRCADSQRRAGLPRRIVEILLPCALLLSFICYAFEKTILGSAYCKYALLFTPTSCLLVWCAADQNSLYSRILSNRLLVRIGNLSACTFLIHQLVLQYFAWFNRRIWNGRINIFVEAAISFAITMLLAYYWNRITGSGKTLIKRALK